MFLLNCYSLRIRAISTAAFFLVALPLFAGEPDKTGMPQGRLVHSYARPDLVVVKHLSLDLVVDFEAKKLSGSATLKIDREPDAKELRLDAHGLDIRKVTDQSGADLTFQAGPKNQLLGEL